LSDVDFARTLAAVMAADVAGYSRLMQQNEDATMAAWWRYRREVVDPAVAANRGRIVKLTGDGFLAEFPSVSDAVTAAVAIQSEIGERLRDVVAGERVEFRIGINLGDILKDDEDIYGDGVNIAARIEALAEPGGIWVSASVHDQVRNRAGFAFDDMGEHSVKNIEQPIRVYRVQFDGAPEPVPVTTESSQAAAVGAAGAAHITPALPRAVATAPAMPSRPSIAVLPFDNIGGDPEQDYFADGMTEDLITELSRFQELLVIARNTVFTYRGQAHRVEDIGRELNVRYVLEGSVRKAGERVRISAQLIDATTGHHVWADRFDRHLEDVFAVQDEVVQRIIATMSGKLHESERNRARSLSPDAMQAYDLLLKGRELWRRFTSETNIQARELYEQAIELDPSYGRAYASLAWTHLMDALERWSDDREKSLDMSLDQALRGIKANPDSHSNHFALGQVYFSKAMHAEALQAQERTISLNPNDPDGYVQYGRVLAYCGRNQEALDQVNKGIGMTNNKPGWYYWTEGTIHYLGGRFEEAITALRRSASPGAGSFRWLAISYAQSGHDEEARAAADEYRRRVPDFDYDYQFSTEPFLRDVERDLYAEGMKKAGLC
jgi:adenylate cyclase